MDNKWKDSLRERFSDYSVPEPEGLWEGIEQGLAGSKRRKAAPIWWISGAAAAAAAVALVVLLPRNAGEKRQPADTAVFAESSLPEREVTADTSAVETVVAPVLPEVRPSAPAVSRRSLLADAAPAAEKFEDIVPEIESVPEVFETPDVLQVTEVPEEEAVAIPETVAGPVSDETGKTAVSLADSVEEQVVEENRVLWADTVYPVKERPAFTFGVYSEGGQQADASSQGYGMSNTEDFFTRAISNNTNTPSGLMRMLSSNRASAFDARHGAPVRMGVTAAWQFLPWLGLESGLNWTRLESELTESTMGTKAVTRQELGYLGVPLRLVAGVTPLEKLRLYAGVGGMAEKCLLASATTDSYFGDHLEGSEASTPDTGGLLWSVGASAGAEYRFSPHVGVYFAPGLEYHFDNGSKVQSAYTAKPLHYNLSLGLRFNFGQ